MKANCYCFQFASRILYVLHAFFKADKVRGNGQWARWRAPSQGEGRWLSETDEGLGDAAAGRDACAPEED